MADWWRSNKVRPIEEPTSQRDNNVMIRIEARDFFMLKHCLQLLLVVSSLILVHASPGYSQSPGDFQCSKGSDVRRIEILFADPSGRLPCRVIYRPETETKSVGTVAWRNIAELETCQAQALQVVDRLRAEDWNCTAILASVESEPPEPAEATAADALSAAEPEPVQAAVEKTASDDNRDEPILLENPDLGTPPPDLVTIVEEDLAKLAATLDGKLEAQIVAYDDLNADDTTDALVLLAYSSPRPAYREFLIAYLFDGEVYQLTATKPIAGSSSDTMNATLDQTDQGIIRLKLEAYEPGDEACCPSGIRQVTLALRNLELVEIDESQPPR